MSKRKYCLSIMALLLLATIKNAQASCAFSPDSTYPMTAAQSFTVPMDNRTLSVPPDTPVGHVFYDQSSNVVIGWRVACSSSPVYVFGDYVTRPKELATGFTDVYQTNLSGIGVRFLGNSNNVPYPYSSQYGSSSSPSSQNSPNFRLQLIKTTETVSPGTILSSSFPTIKQSIGQADSKVEITNLKMNGQFTVTVPTCNIAPASASMTVPMGTHHTSDFSGVGSGTSWKNASIQLINCPQFFGMFKGGYYNSTYYNGILTQQPLSSNTWSLSLTPRNGIIDAANGIMKIDEEAGSSTGVGIQLSSSESTSDLINLTDGVTKSIVKDGSTTTITVPLYARYIQTESTISAGKANGRLEYTITYQ